MRVTGFEPVQALSYDESHELTRNHKLLSLVTSFDLNVAHLTTLTHPHESEYTNVI